MKTIIAEVDPPARKEKSCSEGRPAVTRTDRQIIGSARDRSFSQTNGVTCLLPVGEPGRFSRGTKSNCGHCRENIDSFRSKRDSNCRKGRPQISGTTNLKGGDGGCICSDKVTCLKGGKGEWGDTGRRKGASISGELVNAGTRPGKVRKTSVKATGGKREGPPYRG